MRISFAGGGTDFPAYYEKHGGMVVSTTIDKYVYVIVSPNGQSSLQISSSDYSTFFRHAGGGDVEEDGKLRYARAFLREFGIRSGYSIFMASEMPPGTGLGSSSSLAVALTKALAALGDDILECDDVAQRASDVEINRLHMPIGRQDHYASAFGGLNAIRFSADGVRVEPLHVSRKTRDWLTSSTLLFFTDQSHDSKQLLLRQNQRIGRDESEVIAALDVIKGLAVEARDALLNGQPHKLGEIMHRSWEQKKLLAAGVSNSEIDRAYGAALDAGAIGGKIAGAGGGGFLLLLVPLAHQAAVTMAMAEEGFLRSDFRLVSAGARILVNNAAV